MTLQPDDIEHQVFKERFRGYDQDEVDRFLDQVTDRLVELIAERDAAVERLAAEAQRAERLEQRAEEASQAEMLLKRTLVTAQRTAEDVVAEAKERAAQSVADAQREADDVRAAARVEAEDRLAAARADAEAMVAAARQQAGDLVAEARWRSERVRVAVEELQRFRAEYRERVRAFIAEQLAALDRAGELPEISPALDSLTQQTAASHGDEPRAGMG